MTRQDHLLVILMEECAEVQKECAKALRFGLDDWYAPSGVVDTNREQITHELDDLLGIVGMLRQENIIDAENPEAQDAKQGKVERYLKYSAQKGLLT